MKKLLIISIFISFVNLYPQRADEVGWVSKFGLAGGFATGYMFVNLDPVKDIALELGLDAPPSTGIVTFGGGGYVYLMLVDNLRIGGYGYAGSFSRSGKSGGLDKEIQYDLGGGYVTIEYTIPSIKDLALSFGAMIGGGRLDVDLYQNKGSVTWEDLIDDLKNNLSSENISRSLSNSYFSIAPTVTLDIPLNRFMAFRLGAGYQFTFGGSWEVDNSLKISGVSDELTADAFFFQTGIYLGFFAF